MSVFGNPIDYFNVGRQGGAANSSAVGMAIRDIVAKADAAAPGVSQAYAQADAALPGKLLEGQMEGASKDVWVYNHLTGQMEKQPQQVSSDAIVKVPALSESAITGSMMAQEWQKEQAAKNTNNTPPPQSTSQYLSQPSASVPAPAAPPPAPARGGVAPTGLQSPELQGLDPSVFSTPEGQKILNDVLQKRLRGGGGA